MRRRELILGGAASAIVGSKALASTVNLPNGAKRVFIQAPQIVKQGCPEWCWAASASMIFAMHGHPLDQRAIVQRVYGGVVCQAAQSGIVISQVLSTQWVDGNGQPFTANLTAVFDAMAGVAAINNQFIVDEIAANRPLLYGNVQHAMVLSQVDYVDTAMGPNILGAGVFDPWPGSPDFHPLSRPELFPVPAGGRMGYLAAVRVSP